MSDVSDLIANRITDVAARPDVPDPFEERRRIDEDRQRQLAAREAAAPAPEPIHEEPEPRSDYEVVQSGTWYKLIAPDGEQVGKSQRSEEDAWALLDEGA